MRVILQSQRSECGLACLAMMSSFFKGTGSLQELRRRFAVSVKGASLEQLIRYARAMDMSSRAVRVDLDEVGKLARPCVLHWQFNHFVVLEGVNRNGSFKIVDPARGRVTASKAEFSEKFTGVALELSPSESFETKPDEKQIPLSRLMGRVFGLKLAVGRILCVALSLQLLAIASPMFNQFLIDEAMSRHDVNLANVMLIGFIILMLIQSSLSMLKGWMVITLGQDLSLQWRGKVFTHLLKLPMDFFEKRHIGDIMSRISGLSAMQQAISTTVIGAALNLLMAMAAGVLMIVYAWKLAAVVFASALCYGALRVVFYQPFKQASAERLVLSAKEGTHFIETLRSVQTLKLFNKEAQRQAVWQNLVVDVQNRDVQTAKMSQWFGTARMLIFGVENLVVLWFGAVSIIEGPTATGIVLTLGMFFAFTSYQRQFTDAVGGLIDAAVELRMVGLHTERLSDIVLSRPEEPNRSTSEDDDWHLHVEPVIELRDVGFRYSDGDPWIFRGVSLKISKKDFVAVVGPSGAGKTTLLKVVLGLLKPSEGEVLYGGNSISNIGLSRYRGLIGAVMQEDALVAGSIAENIAFYDEAADMDRVRESAALAGVADEIERMPMGYRTLIGDMGTGLSGGQQQRIFLARALYRKPRILALDEATSHLDVVTERKVLDAMSRMDVSRLVVAHRPDTIAAASRVVEMRDGGVTEIDRVVVSMLANKLTGRLV